MGFSNKKIHVRTKRRVFRVRSKFTSRGEMPRITVFRSLNHLYAQIIDDKEHKTLFCTDTRMLAGKSGNKKDAAKQVGIDLGKKAVQAGVTNVFFDRGRYLYHGRIRALADGLREGGLNF